MHFNLIMDTTFLLRDSGEIYGTYTTLEHAYNSLLQLVYTRYKYHKKDTISSCNIDNMVRAFQIIEYYNNVVKNVYNVDNDYYIYDSKKKMCPMDAISICDYITKIINFKSDEEYACNNMDIFLPVEETERTNPNTDKVPNMNGKEIRELEAQLKTLETKKKMEVVKKEQIEDDIEVDIENDIQQKVVLHSEIHDLERDKRLYGEKKTKFTADYAVFLRIEKEMKNNIRKVDCVPEIFQRSYDVFKKMRLNGIIGKPHDEMFEYFMANLERVDFYNGKHNTLFDAPTFEELKAFCPSDDEYESETESSDESSNESTNEDETNNMINEILDQSSHNILTNRSITYDSDDNTERMIRKVLNGSNDIDSDDGCSSIESDSDLDSDSDSCMSMSSTEKNHRILLHKMMESMSKPHDDSF